MSQNYAFSTKERKQVTTTTRKPHARKVKIMQYKMTLKVIGIASFFFLSFSCPLAPFLLAHRTFIQTTCYANILSPIFENHFINYHILSSHTQLNGHFRLKFNSIGKWNRKCSHNKTDKVIIALDNSREERKKNLSVKCNSSFVSNGKKKK